MSVCMIECLDNVGVPTRRGFFIFKNSLSAKNISNKIEYGVCYK